MARTKTVLTLAEQIERAKDGRSQRWIIDKLKERGFPMGDVSFSNKKNYSTFTDEELAAISEILGTELTPD